MSEKIEMPQINWIKNDPAKHQWFEDGSVFLVALKVRNIVKNETKWDFDVVQMTADGESCYLCYRDGEIYDSWTWDDFEYFMVLEGKEPFPIPVDA